MFFFCLHQLLSAPSISKKVVLTEKLDSHLVRSSFNSFREALPETVEKEERSKLILMICYRRD